MAQADQVGIIGKGIIIKGSLSDGGNLVIEGRVEGQIALKNHLTIETTGKVEADIRAVVEVGHAAGAIVKVIFENAYLTDDEKIRACHLAEAAGADFVKTSTGFAPSGATHDDLRLMRANTSPHVRIKAAGGVRTLDALLAVMELGVTRIGATATEAIILDFRARKAGMTTAGASTGGAGNA